MAIVEEHDHPVASSETVVRAWPEAEAPELSTPTVVWMSLIMPIGMLLFGAALAWGHHAFNAWEDEKLVAKSVVPQHWVTRIGVGFSFGFKSAVEVTMAFVLLQCLWFSVIRQPLTIQQIDTMYRIERQDQLYKSLPLAVLFSPTIVVFSVFTLLLPLSGVFAPGSLTVVTNNSTPRGPCMIPTGNLSFLNINFTDSYSLYSENEYGLWGGDKPKATELTTQCLVSQRIPDLPQACGPNCRYTVSMLSFVFQCTPNPPSLPYAQTGNSLWNGTMDPNSIWGFYIAWSSSIGTNGTWGNASCLPFQAQYDIEVKTKDGVQSVTTNITQIATSPIPDVTNITVVDEFLDNVSELVLKFQLAAISYATRALFLGSAVENSVDTRPPGQPSFLNVSLSPGQPYTAVFVWGDVLKGIEEMSHNITAALLTLNLDTMNSTCSFDQQDEVYKYSSFALWVPYGTSLGVALVSLVFAVMIMGRNKTGGITTSFSDTAILSRIVDKEVSGAKLRLRAAEDGKLKYTPE